MKYLHDEDPESLKTVCEGCSVTYKNAESMRGHKYKKINARMEELYTKRQGIIDVVGPLSDWQKF